MYKKASQAFAIGLLLLIGASAESTPLRIITIHGPPWGFIDGDGKPTGMMYEISNRIAETAGLPYTNALIPYARTAVEIESGRADFVLRFGNAHLDRAAIAVVPIITMPIVLVGPRGVHYRSLEELHGKSVGVVRTSKYVDAFDSDTAIDKYPVNDYLIMARMIATGRLDAGVGSSAGLYYGAFLAGIKPEQLGAPLVLGENQFILYFSIKNAKPETVKALRNAVNTLCRNGEIRNIVHKYLAASGFDLVVKPSHKRPLAAKEDCNTD